VDASDDEPRARDRLSEVDARLVHLFERHLHARMARDLGVPLRVREPALHVDPAEWRTGFLAVREYEVPWELEQDLHQMTPQALLRDLFRPVYQLFWHEREQQFTLDWGGRRAVADARAAQRREPRPELEFSTVAMSEELERHRTLLRERWQAILPDDAPRKEVTVLHDPSLR
jgi:hypothetical protein